GGAIHFFSRLNLGYILLGLHAARASCRGLRARHQRRRVPVRVPSVEHPVLALPEGPAEDPRIGKRMQRRPLTSQLSSMRDGMGHFLRCSLAKSLFFYDSAIFEGNGPVGC